MEAPKVPRRHDYRQRAHCNPLSDRIIPYPLDPSQIDWTEFYPILKSGGSNLKSKVPSILDIGCGFGGMSFALSPMFPDNLILAFEIRCSITAYVEEKLKAYHAQNLAMNVAAQWANTMRTLTRYIEPNTIEKLFILFPDPHFKKRKTKWRIISSQLMDEYTYVMKDGARFYLVTDVLQYFEYAMPILEGHPLLKKVEDYSDDPSVKLATTATEESQRVTDNKGQKFIAVFERVKREM